MPELKCFACEREPTQQCPRCGRPYCDEHGEDFCNVCLEPASGVPSFTLYRGSLVALLLGALLAIWLILQPSSESSGSALIVVTPTRAPAGALTTPPPGSGSPQATQGSPQAGTTPAATSAATRPAGTTTTPTSSTPTTGGATGEYVVVSGDTLTAICSDKIRRPASQSVTDCVAQIKTLNNLTSDNLEVGQRLKVPQ